MRLLFDVITAVLLTAVSATAGAQVAACGASERTVWSCQSGRKVYALCASADLGAQAGYLQYRVQSGGALAFVFPRERRHPHGLFEAIVLARGASVRFSNDGYTYAIDEPLAGRTTIDVVKQDKPVSSVTCRQASDTLTLTDVQAYFRQVGILR